MTSQLNFYTGPTCSIPGFSGLYNDLVSTCSGATENPFFGIRWKLCKAFSALGSSEGFAFPIRKMNFDQSMKQYLILFRVVTHGTDQYFCDSQGLYVQNL